MKTLPHLIQQNRNWADGISKNDPEFFAKLSEQQAPDYLWIGCADSRVPATEILNMVPGEIFVHRNIANLVIHTDMNLLSVVQYAVDHLKVEHIIICGHYGCGGIEAALKPDSHGLVDNWLRHVEDIASLNAAELSSLEWSSKVDRLCELNVIHQTSNLARTSVVQEAWARGQRLDLHSWIYRLQDGHIQSLMDPINDANSIAS